jgi:rhamnogalacturonan endolyase
MVLFKLLGLAGLVAAAPLEDRAKKPKSFLKELGNSTWVIGNEIWNVTQNRQYANRLWYKGKDRVGDAVGHYVSYSTSARTMCWIKSWLTRWMNRWRRI